MKITKIKKNVLTIVLMVAMILPLAACGNDKDTSGDAGTDEVYELKFAHVVRPTTPKGAAAEEFKKLIEKKSDGRIKVTIYADSQMGNDQEINEQILEGTLDMNAPFLSTVTSFVEEFELFDLPYLFTSNESAYAALEGEVGAKLDSYLEEKGLVSLGYWTGGFKQITNSVKPIKSVKDLDGLKIRVSQSPLLVTQFRAINAGGISVPFSDLYSSLQTKTVDGQENPFANIATKKFYEVQDYMTISDHGFMGYSFFMNKDKFESMPSDLQELTKEVAQEVMEWEWEETVRKDEEYLQEIKDAGVTIDEFDEAEKAEFKEVTKEAYDEFLEKEDGEELLNLVDKYTK
ncbi:TRAP transporter substrate-binding protein [Clostridium sp. D2Q-14]|uniref:TRAP transporter substrate-binding protein n=1 Tax=Anaeromonas gelatinilytica TaxID=2683194 RepID=UPI00193B0EA0|nr:TRAP transporter substrate-binding protein [Anaeromonas gelatinilytica]MBS4535060.1 TRAP transporter substrate-binding protein [Anaeromonas gelatinilytica]